MFNRLLSVVALGSLVSLAACAPQIAYAPANKEAPSPAQVVDAAIELKNAVEVDKLVASGRAETLGEMRFTDNQVMQLGLRNSPSHFTERAAAEAAARGGTHFYVAGFDDKHQFVGMNDDLVVIRYTIYRVDPGAWSTLDPSVRPRRVASN
jgi:hypothetical protein